MAKLYAYQYVCFDIRNKGDIDGANKQLAELASQGYQLDYSITESRKEGLSEIRVNRLRKEIKK
ncbi:MAG: hypothetical protein KGI05_09590 [Thaumarchaeota archaeon]|nr:hypothetical protein [Nitrososphaerota archaeon]